MENEEELDQLGFGPILPCARSDCDRFIVEKTSWNQKFCSSECTRIETNRRIMQKYYDKKDQLSGKKRLCESCNQTVLSRYNDTKICSSCEQKEEKDRNAEFKKMMQEMGVFDAEESD